MAQAQFLKNLFDNNLLQENLYKGIQNDHIRNLQRLLHEMGFGEELKWDRYGADGDFGGATTAALKAFATKAGISSDGATVSPQLAESILHRYSLLDDLQHLANAIEEKKIKELYSKEKGNKVATAILQTLLNELGYGQELQWETNKANGIYGNNVVAALQAFGRKENVPSDGTALGETLARRILGKLAVFYGSGLAALNPKESLRSGLLVDRIKKNGKTYVKVSDGIAEKQFSRFKRGLYTIGNQKPMSYLDASRSALLDRQITEAAINVMVAVADNEGNLDAINTWDNSFMSFGLFQWTIGASGKSGELPSLLKKIKTNEPEAFQKYFGQYGLGVSSDTGKVYGYLTLDGKKMKSGADKAPFRSETWAFRFWQAGQDDLIKAVQVEHALSRLKTFYWTQKAGGFPLAELVSSEYGVGLLLDNHVNRPGYVAKCVGKALQQTGLGHPQQWTTEDERKLINAYIQVRVNYGNSPMTDAMRRAQRTKKYLDKGTISDERGSFKLEEGGTRGLEIGQPPFDFNAEDYPAIRHFDEEQK